MKIDKIFQNNWVKPALFVAGGILLGWLIFHQSAPVKTTESSVVQEDMHDEAAHQIWTCAMHPQIRMDKPGTCPICGMELIPLQAATSNIDEDAVHMTDAGMKLAEVQTTIIGRQNAAKNIRLYGKVQADERRVKTQAAHVPGRIEELKISFTGELVTKGQVIARIYSPSLVTAQEELLQAKQLKPAQPALIEAAREKLLQWKLTSTQIEAIEQSGKTQSVFDVTANVSGVVISKKVNQGDYVQQGAPLFEVTDLSRVWVLFDAYESDLPWIKLGNAILFTLESLPGQQYSGNVSFIDPVVNPTTRVAQVRVEASNPGAILKPEMFVNGNVNSALPKYNDGIVIPQSAVLWTGPRSVVYVKIQGTEEPEFKLREIELGPALSNSYVVLSGLLEGEEIVTNGTFAIDASAQLSGKPSMMNPEGNQGNSGGMAGMDMGNDAATHGVTTSHPVSNNSDASPSATLSRARTKTEMQMIKVSGNCDMCKERIETAAKSVSGVTLADWSAETKMLHVEFNGEKTNADAIQKAIAAVGHDTEKYKASNLTYKELPECCLYRK